MNRPVALSTHYLDSWSAEMAIDSDPSTCTHTVEDLPDPWWTIDFGGRVYVKNISILNRSDGDPAICELSLDFSSKFSVAHDHAILQMGACMILMSALEGVMLIHQISAAFLCVPIIQELWAVERLFI